MAGKFQFTLQEYQEAAVRYRSDLLMLPIIGIGDTLQYMMSRPGSSNSLTLSWLLIDEAKFINYGKLKDETLPANGGIKSHFGRHSFNHSVLILSDMPQTKKGSWFLHYREKMDTELIATIEGTVYEIWRVRERIRQMRAKRQSIPAYLRGHLRRLDRQLNQMRSVAVYYREYSSIENLQLLGENYIKQMTAKQGSNASCPSSTAPTTKTSFSLCSQPVSAVAATASARTSPAKSSRRAKKTCSNTAPTAPTRFLPFGRSYFVVDTLYIGCEKFPYWDSFSLTMSGVL